MLRSALVIGLPLRGRSLFVGQGALGFFLLVFILFKFGYPLNKSKLETMYSELRTRRDAGEEKLEVTPS